MHLNQAISVKKLHLRLPQLTKLKAGNAYPGSSLRYQHIFACFNPRSKLNQKMAGSSMVITFGVFKVSLLCRLQSAPDQRPCPWLGSDFHRDFLAG